jgi:hypothetical protein
MRLLQAMLLGVLFILPGPNGSGTIVQPGRPIQPYQFQAAPPNQRWVNQPNAAQGGGRVYRNEGYDAPGVLPGYGEDGTPVGGNDD